MFITLLSVKGRRSGSLRIHVNMLYRKALNDVLSKQNEAVFALESLFMLDSFVVFHLSSLDKVTFRLTESRTEKDAEAHVSFEKRKTVHLDLTFRGWLVGTSR